LQEFLYFLVAHLVKVFLVDERQSCTSSKSSGVSSALGRLDATGTPPRGRARTNELCLVKGSNRGIDSYYSIDIIGNVMTRAAFHQEFLHAHWHLARTVLKCLKSKIQQVSVRMVRELIPARRHGRARSSCASRGCVWFS
jgi:hypothetical protein